MRFKKSIFLRGIVFVLGVIAISFFSFSKVEAVCTASFADGSQYLTIGGKKSSWQDTKLIATGDGACSIVINSIDVNGEHRNTDAFAIDASSVGSYTIGYNYTINDSENGTIFRYLRILDDAYNTSNNYAISDLEFSAASKVIDSYNVGSANKNYFVSFIVDDTNSYITISDEVNRVLIKQTLVINTAFIIEKVYQENATTYYVVGNNATGGVVGKYTINISDPSIALDPSNSFTQSGYKFTGIAKQGNVVYVSGSKDGLPIVATREGVTFQNLHTYPVTGQYNNVIVSNGVVYAVGSSKNYNTTIENGLYSYCNLGTECTNSDNWVNQNLIGTSANTIFYDIVADGDYNIVVGESDINEIYANNAIIATNLYPGHKHGLLLKVSKDGTSTRNAFLLGNTIRDTLDRITLLSENDYAVVGTRNDGTISLVYNFHNGETNEDFYININDAFSTSNLISGVVKYNHGYGYYGMLKSNLFLDVYYPKTISDSVAMFVTLDNRKYSNNETINITHNSVALYCDYSITFGEDTGIQNEDCKLNPSQTVNTGTLNAQIITKYFINEMNGVYVRIFRVINITSAPVPFNLNSLTTGVSKWYVYNRPTVITEQETSLDRIDYTKATTNYTYAIEGDISLTVFDLIDYYIEHGNSRGYNLVYSTANIFEKNVQTTAAFASLEYAKMFAYYQELSRVVRIQNNPSAGQTPSKYGANGESVDEGTPYYIYYIDFKGNSNNDSVQYCSITRTSINNCSGKGGYVFTSLNTLKETIENFLIYNNYFVSPRNSNYNGLISKSNITEYQETLTTKEYVSNLYFSNYGTNLNFNIKDEATDVLLYTGTNRNIYFGGKVKETIVDSNRVYTYEKHPLVPNALTVSKVDNGAGYTYYENTTNNALFFNDNRCYIVYYTYEDGGNIQATGTSRTFCLDTTGPTIIYQKDHADTTEEQTVNSSFGVIYGNPTRIENDFKIVGLDDLDDYAFITINGTRYTITCSNNSITCLNEIESHIKQHFRFDVNNPDKIYQITFTDRLGNPNTFYFVIGTTAPSIVKENQQERNGFDIVIDFYNTNRIKRVTMNVSKQTCMLSDTACYTGDDPIDEHDVLESFNDDLNGYISAVYYRDNEIQVDTLLAVGADDRDYYSIKNINHKLISEYLIQVENYESEIEMDENKRFVYNEVNYLYNVVDKTIQKLIVEDSSLVIDPNFEPINAENAFSFEESDIVELDEGVFAVCTNILCGNAFKIVEEDGEYKVARLPFAYPIYNTNLVEVDNIVYTINYSDKALVYANPLINNLKKITLYFRRTTNGSIEGIDIPRTVVHQVNGVDQIDSYGQKIYEFYYEDDGNGNLELQYNHYNLIDGVYTFKMEQYFYPTSTTVQGSINVTPLVFNAGVSRQHEDLGIIYAQYDFEGSIDTATTQALEKLEDNYKYPISYQVIPALSAYQSTHFVNRTVYLEYTAVPKSVLVIRVYKQKNAYGLPNAEGTKTCKAVFIYNSTEQGFTDPTTIPGIDSINCSEGAVALAINNFSNDYSANGLNLGITQIFQDQGAFALNGNNMYYEVSLTNYNANNTPASETLYRYFYIDNSNPIDSISVATSGVYDLNNPDTQIVGYSFTQVEGVYKLNNDVGSTYGVAIHGEGWYDLSTSSTIENKLLLMNISDGFNFSQCNVYKLLTDAAYETGCRNYIDVDNSHADDSGFFILFSESANYIVTLLDASQNGITFSFVIDKQAPLATLSGVEDGSNSIGVILEASGYFAQSFVKNPKFTINFSDNSQMSVYHYMFFDKNGTALDLGGGITKGNNGISGTNTSVDIYLGDTITQYFENNNYDANATLAFWAVDSLQNGEIDNLNLNQTYLCTSGNAKCVNFWVDYTKPTISFEKENLNEIKISRYDISNEITDNGNYTITISSNDYSSQSSFICANSVVNSFTFTDPNYTALTKPYTFNASCSDIHAGISGQYAESFDNTRYLKFYEVTVDNTGASPVYTRNKANAFQFGIPTADPVRYIWIVAMDTVGNESTDELVVSSLNGAGYIILPIIVDDALPPTVESVTKNIDGSEVETVEYIYPFADSSNAVYLTNGSVTVTFNERIAKVLSCVSKVDNKTSGVNNGTACDEYSNNQEFTYNDAQVSFSFAEPDAGYFRIIIFSVADFGSNPSNKPPLRDIVIVIDKMLPVIDFTEDGGDNSTIEYLGNEVIYDNTYDYRSHAIASDEQGISGNAGFTVNVTYQVYSPTVTFNNYRKVENGNVVTYEPIADGSSRGTGSYYLDLPKNMVMSKNKECVFLHDVGGEDYCYVLDNQGTYFFNSKKEVEDGNFWKNSNTINSSKIGVYRIRYEVVDKAGNVSDPIYKLIFVNDTIAPDGSIHKNGEELYSSVASTNPDGFNGKLNSSVDLYGTDYNNNQNIKLVMYYATYEDYENDTTLIEQDVFNYDKGRVLRIAPSGYAYSLGQTSANGKIYKIYIYDDGKYEYNEDLGIYYLVRNVSYFYCAISTSSVDINYTVYGNANSTYTGYVYSDINYYAITNGATKDVALMRCDDLGENCVNVAATAAIGYASNYDYEPNGTQIKFHYYDAQGRVVYEIVYGANQDNSLFLHKTYYWMNGSSMNICTLTDINNNCSTDNAFVVNSVKAYVYIDGVYYMKFMDNYGNLSNFVNFKVDNTASNTNKANYAPTGINYWFAVPSEVVTTTNYTNFSEVLTNGNKIIDILDVKYEKFNSEFFYAFASEQEAKTYIETLYRDAINNAGGNFVFVNLDGTVVPYDGLDTNTIMNNIRSTILGYIFRVQTYTHTNVYFGNDQIKQVKYEDSQSMFKYVYILETKSKTGAHTINRTYQYRGDTCTVTNEDTERCIKVELKIVSNSNTSINLAYNANENKITCLLVNTGDSNNIRTNTACNFNAISQTNGAMYIFIESDSPSSPNHENITSYGIIAYNETPAFKTASYGKYIPVEKLTFEDEDGLYLWFNNKRYDLTEINTTNLYANNGAETCIGTKGCIYVEYLSRFTGDGKPLANGGYYYDYDNNQLVSVSNASDLVTNLSLDTSYSKIKGYGSTRDCSDDVFCQSIPTKINEINRNGNTFTIYSNKKTYIKLFDETTANVSLNRIFEINVINDNDGNPREVYSYATFSINGKYENINDYIISEIITNGVSKTIKYRCVIEVPNEEFYAIVVRDRAGNELSINISNSSVIPDITYTKLSEATNSNVEISLATASNVASFIRQNVTVYKYDGNAIGNTAYQNTTCLEYNGDISMTALVKNMTLTFKYNSQTYETNCSGVYRVKVLDNHGNSKYKDFVFNPYDLTTNYVIDDSINTIHEYEENETKGVIVNNNFSLIVDAELNYLNVYRYPSYAALNLAEVASDKISKITINNFNTNTTSIASCIIHVEFNTNDSYRVYLEGDRLGHTCDGIYVFEVVNRFSDTISKNAVFKLLDGGNEYPIKEVVTYNGAKAIEIDTVSPLVYKDGVANFAIKVDEEDSNDANTLVNSTSKTITYTNKYIRVAWGKDDVSFSFASLKYRFGKNSTISYVLNKTTGTATSGDSVYQIINDSFTGTNNIVYNIDWDNDVVTDGVNNYEIVENEFTAFFGGLSWQTKDDATKYDYDSYSDSVLFKFTEEGIYRCEFIFVDAVGNESEEVYTLLISVVPPKLGFYEFNKEGNQFVIGAKYDDNERIAGQTILQCSSFDEYGRESLSVCSKLSFKYEYNMEVNGVSYPEFSNENYLLDVIRINSTWLNFHMLNEKEELRITLRVNVAGKDEIRTTLHLIIDNKAPQITFDGRIVGTTYVDVVNIYISSEDNSNEALIYYCDEVEKCVTPEEVDERYLFARIDQGATSYVLNNSYSGYFKVVAYDGLGNTSSNWISLDTKAPTIEVTTTNTIISPNMFTNAKSVFARVIDNMSQTNSYVEVKFAPLFPLGNEEYEEVMDGSETIKVTTLTYDSLIGLTREGKYILTPVDGVGHKGRSISFFIYRQTPKYDIYTNSKKNTNDEGNEDSVVSSSAYVTWKGRESILEAPIVNVTLDGATYQATYSTETNSYKGATVETVGEHIFVLTDAASNRTTIMITINNTNKVCINGNIIEVKMQAYRTLIKKTTVDEEGLHVSEKPTLTIGGEDGVNYSNNDVVIFALPSRATGTECDAEGVLSYRTIDNENSHFLIESDRVAKTLRENAFDFVKQGFISEAAIKEIENVGGTVIVFVVSKDVANGKLGYHVGTNFFLEDPIGWSIIFVLPLTMIWPSVRLFVKKKVKVL